MLLDFERIFVVFNGTGMCEVSEIKKKNRDYSIYKLHSLNCVRIRIHTLFLLKNGLENARMVIVV
jgi:hypothetical protein